MKKILAVVESFLRKHPTPSDISLVGPMLQLTYSYSSPFTNSKNNKVLYLAREDLPKQTSIEPTYKKLTYN
jgi:hypothetical protein